MDPREATQRRGGLDGERPELGERVEGRLDTRVRRVEAPSQAGDERDSHLLPRAEGECRRRRRGAVRPALGDALGSDLGGQSARALGPHLLDHAEDARQFVRSDPAKHGQRAPPRERR